MVTAKLEGDHPVVAVDVFVTGVDNEGFPPLPPGEYGLVINGRKGWDAFKAMVEGNCSKSDGSMAECRIRGLNSEKPILLLRSDMEKETASCPAG